MKNLAILLTNDYRLLSVAAIQDVFETLNRMLLASGEEAFAHIHFLHVQDAHRGAFNSIHFSALEQADIIFIPAFSTSNVVESLRKNSVVIPWLRAQYERGAALASVCTGAFLLGATGVLNGKRATTHYDAATAFETAFPEVKLQIMDVVTEDDQVYTSGGATSSFHLMLYMVRKYVGNENAVKLAKMFAIDLDRCQQACYGRFSPRDNHTDELVRKTEERIREMYREEVTIEEIVREIPASRRNIIRRFKLATGVTPIEYLQKTRIEAAKKLLEQTNKSISEIMLDTGYNDLKSFRKLFQRNTGIPPVAYREKFRNLG